MSDQVSKNSSGENDQPPKSIKDQVLAAIQSGDVEMRPKWKFVISTAFLIVGIVLVALSLLYLGSFIVFTLRQTGLWFLPGFGLQGLGIFFKSLPWVLVFLTLVFIFLLQVMIRRYSFIYGVPLMYSVLGIIFLVIAGGVSLGLSPLHQRLERGGEGMPLYRQYDQEPGDFTIGTITQKTGTGYFLQDPRQVIFMVIVTPQTQTPQSLNTGDDAAVLGQRQGNTITAVIIRKLGQLPPPPPDNDSFGNLPGPTAWPQ
jgi:hypothetical protein